MAPSPPSTEVLRRLIRSETVTDSPDGPDLFEASLSHGVVGVVAVAAAEGRVRLDPVDQRRFEIESLGIEHSNRRSLQVVRDIAQALEGTGLSVGLIKGLAVSLMVYERLDVRPAGDIDLFVGPCTDPIAVVEALGIELSDLELTTIRQLTKRRAAFEFSFEFEGFEIDLHSDPMNLLLPSRQSQLIWDRTVPLDLGDGLSIQTLDPDLALLQTLIHLARDSVADLIRISDVRLMIAKLPDIALISQFAQDEGWSAILGEVSHRVFVVLDEESPFERASSRSARVFFSRLWPESRMLLGQRSRARSGLRQYWLGAAISGRRRDAAKEVQHRVFPPDEIVRFRGPSQKGPYPWRLLAWRRAQRQELHSVGKDL